jgi:hypothetical protein
MAVWLLEFQIIIKQLLGNWMFPSSGEGKEAPTLLGSLERVLRLALSKGCKTAGVSTTSLEEADVH